MDRRGSNFHCVKCKIAYMNFDQMYDHIKKFHVEELLSGLTKQEPIDLESRITKPESPAEHESMELEKSEIEESESDKMEKIVAKRKNYAEILKNHFYGTQRVTDQQKLEGKACLEQLLTGVMPMETEKGKAVQQKDESTVTLKDLLSMPSTSSGITEQRRATPDAMIPQEAKATPVSEDEEEKLVILKISEMENLMTKNLMQLYEGEAERNVPRLATPKRISSDTQIDHESLKIIQTMDTEEEGVSTSVAQVRTRVTVDEMEDEEGEDETEKSKSYWVEVSGVHPKYKNRKLDEINADKLRRQKVVTLSSRPEESRREYPSTSGFGGRGQYVPKVKKEVEYDSDDECYYYVECDETPDPHKEERDSEIREILDDKFGGIEASKVVDPYFEYLWKTSFEVKDRMYDSNKATDVFKAHAWTQSRL